MTGKWSKDDGSAEEEVAMAKYRAQKKQDAIEDQLEAAWLAGEMTHAEACEELEESGHGY
ncbi:hypothetical protein SEA_DANIELLEIGNACE_57 [Arthrobacter phage DanielleIgnace]|nr:hypothetical protein SEA_DANIELLEIGNACE_57 [Arthrobacter phage DanielleIgnace]